MDDLQQTLSYRQTVTTVGVFLVYAATDRFELGRIEVDRRLLAPRSRDEVEVVLTLRARHVLR